MKRIGFAAAAIAAFVVGFVPMTASAQRRGQQPAGPPPLSAQQLEQGMKEAPAAVAAAKLACAVKEAALIGSNTDAKKQKVNFYEVSCNQGIGYLVQSAPDGARGFDCLSINAQAAADTAAGKPGSPTCRLPGNADPKQGLAPYLASASRTCTITNARPMGATGAGDVYYEAACDGGKGYVIKALASGAPAEVQDCAEFLGSQAECQLTPKAQIVSSLGALATQGGSACTASDARYVGSGASGSFFEVACGEGKPGYMVQTNKAGAFQVAYECSKAAAIGGGCTLTKVDVSEQAEAATYTKLAKANGYPCEVSKYRFIGVDNNSKSEVVELACSNRADGAVALFPTNQTSKGQVLDCVTSASVGVGCSLTPANATYAKYTTGLASLGKTSCKVSNAKWLGATTEGNDLIETACSDGLPGFVLSIPRATGQVKELLSCGQARAAGAACTLPTNTASAAR